MTIRDVLRCTSTAPAIACHIRSPSSRRGSLRFRSRLLADPHPLRFHQSFSPSRFSQRHRRGPSVDRWLRSANAPRRLGCRHRSPQRFLLRRQRSVLHPRTPHAGLHLRLFRGRFRRRHVRQPSTVRHRSRQRLGLRSRNVSGRCRSRPRYRPHQPGHLARLLRATPHSSSSRCFRHFGPRRWLAANRSVRRALAGSPL